MVDIDYREQKSSKLWTAQSTGEPKCGQREVWSTEELGVSHYGRREIAAIQRITVNSRN